jgi:hypothetical protein
VVVNEHVAVDRLASLVLCYVASVMELLAAIQMYHNYLNKKQRGAMMMMILTFLMEK